MGKNKERSIPSKEALQRMNFLYQASLLMAASSSCTSDPVGNDIKKEEPQAIKEKTHNPDEKKQRDAQLKGRESSLFTLSRFYANDIKVIARKNVLRMYDRIKWLLFLEISCDPIFIN